MAELILLCHFNIQNWFVCSPIRKWTAYANEVNSVNKNSPIWLAPRAGKMNQIARCDRLLERARWSRSGLPAVSRKQIFSQKPYNKSFIDQVFSVKMAWYWPGFFSFYEFMDFHFVSVHKHAKKVLGQYPAFLTSHLVNNPYIYHVDIPKKTTNENKKSTLHGITTCRNLTFAWW